MIKCAFCGTNHAENTLFCDECGSYLDPRDEQATNALKSQAADRLKRGRGARRAVTSLALEMEDGKRIELPLNKSIILGRLDPSRGSYPEVDLGQQSKKKGVSRQHAKISRRRDEVFIEDLKSLNGTFLNDSRIVSGQPYPLRDGDQVRLGKLPMTIRLQPSNSRDG